jgi:hypothetical protein
MTIQAGPVHCRFDGVADPKGRYDGKPAHYVHTDYSPRSFAMTVEALPIDAGSYSRCAVYNFWRVVTPPPQSQPLAVCDVTTLRSGDEQVSKVTLSYPDGRNIEFYTQLYHPNARHRWYYFSDMTVEEVLVFKSFDTDANRASSVPHCAFRDWSQPGNSKRVSVEARILATFKS